MYSLSVVVLAYNEEENLERCIHVLNPVLKSLKREYEIVIVNDGSKDKTGEIARNLSQKDKRITVIENNPNKGYGGAWKTGAMASKNDIVVMVHADNQFDFSEVSKLLTLLEQKDADLVSGIRTEDSDAVHRRIFRWGWNTLVRALFGYLASDVDCGFKVFKRDVLEKVSLPSNGAMLDTQLYAGMRARSLKIEEMPVKHLPRTAGKSTGGNPKVIFKALYELVIFWWQLRFELMVERGRAVFKWEAISILIIVLFAGFLRFYKIGDYMTFLGDEGRDAAVVRDMILGRKYTLLGPGTSIGNMYLGPLYYYLMIPALAIADFSPVGPSVMVGLFGIATIFLIWWIARQWFDRVSALGISALYAVSPVVINYSRSSWNPNIMPFFSLLCMYAICKVWRFGYWRWLVICAVSFAFVINSHYLGLLLLPVIGIFWFISKKTLNATRYTIISIFVFLILMSPLLFFDLRHNWTNAKNIEVFFTNRQTTINLKAYKAIPQIWPIWQNINSSLITAREPNVTLAFSIFLPISLLFVLYKTRSKDLVFTLVWISVGLVGLGLYKQHVYDHYFGFLFPVPFLLLGFVLEKIKPVSYLIILALIVLSLINSPLRYSPNYQLKHTQQVSDLIIKESLGQPFNLALIAKQNYDASYRYALDLKSAPFYTIHQKLSEQLFVVCEDPVCQPIGHPLWEIAAFGWAKIDTQWDLPWGTKVFRLVHNPSGK